MKIPDDDSDLWPSVLTAVPAPLDTTSISYLDYTIDPSGNLFGNTVCGTNNFQNYLVFNPPYTTANPSNINIL